jgi:hypothetical protein
MATLDEIVDKLHAAAKGVGEPTTDELENAPKIFDWTVELSGDGGAVLVGVVVGHPVIHDGPVTTSRLQCLDIAGGWARTRSRWYRLGHGRFAQPVTQYGPLVLEVRQIVGTIARAWHDAELRTWAGTGAIAVDNGGKFSSPNLPSGRLPPPTEDDEGVWMPDRGILIELALRVASARALRWHVDEQRLLPMPDTWRAVLDLQAGERFPRVAIGAGWLDLLLAVDDWLIEQGQTVNWEYVGEKYGSVRLGPKNELDDLAAEIVDHAEDALSQWICDICGSPGKRREGAARLVTRCDEHAGG